MLPCTFQCKLLALNSAGLHEISEVQNPEHRVCLSPCLWQSMRRVVWSTKGTTYLTIHEEGYLVYQRYQVTDDTCSLAVIENHFICVYPIHSTPKALLIFSFCLILLCFLASEEWSWPCGKLPWWLRQTLQGHMGIEWLGGDHSILTSYLNWLLEERIRGHVPNV